MLRIVRLRQPNKNSGTAIGPGQTAVIRSVKITNDGKHVIHVGTFTRKPWNTAVMAKKKKPKKKTKKEETSSTGAA
jgi:hypothetical protein